MSLRPAAPTRCTLEELRASPTAVVTIKDAAAILNVNPRTLSGALTIHGGDVPSRRIGRRVVIPREAFLAWLEPATVGSSATPAPDVADTHSTATVATIRTKLVELLSELEGVQR